jgi:hypothetical protein
MSTPEELTGQQASAFRGIMGSFGASIPQISTVIGIVIGSLGLPKYFDAGSWTIIAVLSFSLVYLYRRYIPRTVPTATLLVAFLFLISGVVGFVLWRSGIVSHDPAVWSETAKRLSSAYLALTITLPVAVLLTSYQRQEEVLGMTFPKKIEKAAREQLLTVPFYKSKVVLKTKVEKIDEQGAVLLNDMWYRVTNRTKQKQEWKMEYGFSDNKAEVEIAEVNGEPVDKEEIARRYRYDNGVLIPREIGPKKSLQVHFRVRQRYRHEDGEIYSTYTPATDLTVKIENSFKEIEFYLESLYGTEPKKTVSGNEQSMSLGEGVLPYQGVRVKWRRKKVQ